MFMCMNDVLQICEYGISFLRFIIFLGIKFAILLCLYVCNMEYFKEYTIVPIIGDGNCFFRAVSYCLNGHQNEHREIRLKTTDYITSNWPKFQNFLIGHECHEYNRFMKADGQHADQVEISAVAEMNPNCNFRVHVRNNESVIIHGSGHVTHELLYSFDNVCKVGHYDVLSSTPAVATKKKRKRTATLTGRRETNQSRASLATSRDKLKPDKNPIVPIPTYSSSFSDSNVLDGENHASSDKLCDNIPVTNIILMNSNNRKRKVVQTEMSSPIEAIKRSTQTLNKSSFSKDPHHDIINKNVTLKRKQKATLTGRRETNQSKVSLATSHKKLKPAKNPIIPIPTYSDFSHSGALAGENHISCNEGLDNLSVKNLTLIASNKSEQEVLEPVMSSPHKAIRRSTRNLNKSSVMKDRCDITNKILHSKHDKNEADVSKSKCDKKNKVDVSKISTVEPFSVGTLSEICPFCSALYFKGEKNSRGEYSLCCYNGKVKLPTFTILDQMKDLFTKNDNFRDNIRQYNNAMSFVSFGAKVEPPPSNYGPYCFKIQGVVHHRISNLYAPNDLNALYGQLYILDFDKANEIRMSYPANDKLDEGVLNILSNLLDKHNPYVNCYKNMHQKIEEERLLSLKENRPQVSFEMRFYNKPSADPRRYNKPTASEVAAVFETVDGAPPSYRNITVYQKDGSLQKIDYDSMHCDPMSYPLIWPCGESGWHIETLIEGSRVTKIRKTVTMREFILYRIAVRGKSLIGDFNPIINAGKLTQQIFVDYYCRIEGDRLKFVRREQARLRVETYVGLADALQVRAEKENLKVGRIVILPSSFTGSPRNMMQNYQDAMALVRQFGKPDLFITFTCNAGWPEIKNSIHPWETANNRPDIVVRVFHAKVKELLRLITVRHIFGGVKCFIYTVEFQKRGLPHIHSLLTLEDDCKFREPKDIDKVVSAEIPHPSNKQLYNLVKKHMVHGPCGSLNPKSPCMVDGVCQKRYPKDYVEETRDNVNGYPLYKRRDDGVTLEKTVEGKKIPMDNRDIVPYNPFLLQYFQAHINVEVCSSVRSVKYIHKYVYKGHDCCNLTVSKTNDNNEINHDEITMFLNARYVSPTEAAYRINAYYMHEQSHPVVRLPVHLPDAQQVYFQTDKAEQALLQAELRHTQLVAWFKLNSNPVTRSSYIYPETPLHYTWSSSDYSWHLRKKATKTIGRMYMVSPTEVERYHLRLLLLHVVGATSFEDVRTYKNVTYNTFKEAAVARKLTADDTEWHRCLEEAATFQMPSQLRDMFAYICIFQQPTNALKLWETFKDVLSEDYSRCHTLEVAHQLSLRDMSDVLKLHGYSLLSFNLPNFDDFSLPIELDGPHLIPALQLNEMKQKANPEQTVIIDEIMHLVQKNDTSVSNAYFIDGPGGTGKTFIYQYLIHSCLKEGFTVISVAWTGIAAMLLPHGRTVHSRFKFPLNLNEDSVSSLKIQSKEADLIRKSRMIIWDEAPMSNKHALKCFDRLLRDVMGKSIPFGGKIVVLGGDFRQVLPVVPHASRATIVNNSIKFSPLWPLFKIFELKTNMRANDDAQEFAKFLLQIGNGEYPTLDPNETGSLIDLPESIISEQDIVTEIYGNGENLSKEPSHLSKVAILAPKNDHCEIINDKVLKLLPGVEKVYTSVNKLITDDSNEQLQFPTEFLGSLEVSGLPPHKLHLKVGCVVMLLRNLNAQKGLLNGTRLVVKQMYENSLCLEVITGINVGKKVLLSRIDLIPSDTVLPFSFKRRQFPIKLAFCMTINKAQGQTLERVGVYLPDPVFSHGQLYVALSRAKCFSNIKVEIKPKGCRTANVVWKEVLKR